MTYVPGPLSACKYVPYKNIHANYMQENFFMNIHFMFSNAPRTCAYPPALARSNAKEYYNNMMYNCLASSNSPVRWFLSVKETSAPHCNNFTTTSVWPSCV